MRDGFLPSLPATAVTPPRIGAPEGHRPAFCAEVGTSKRPFSRPKRFVRYRTTLSGVNVSGLLLRRHSKPGHKPVRLRTPILGFPPRETRGPSTRSTRCLRLGPAFLTALRSFAPLRDLSILPAQSSLRHPPQRLSCSERPISLRSPPGWIVVLSRRITVPGPLRPVRLTVP